MTGTRTRIVRDVLSMEEYLDDPLPDSHYENKSRRERVEPRWLKDHDPWRNPLNGQNPLSVGPFRFGVGGGNRVIRGSKSMA